MFLLKLIILFLTYEKILAQNCTSRYTPYFNGTCMSVSSCQGATLNNLCPGSLKCCIPESASSEGFVSIQTLASLTGSSQTDRLSFISGAIKAPTANPTCFHKSAFLAQLLHESANFRSDEEIGNEAYFSKYDGRPDLGNTQPGDGAKFRGRGFIQITGRDVYTKGGAYIGVDLVNEPERAAFPSNAGKLAFWFYNVYKGINLNQYADGTFYSFTRLTQIINGGINGLADRTLLLEKAFSLFSCGDLSKGKGETCQIDMKDAACKPVCTTGLENKEYCGCNGKAQEKGTNNIRLCTPANEKVASNIRCCLEKKNNVDLGILLDSSGSIAPSDFQKSLVFIKAMVQSLNISENSSRVAIINFSYTLSVVTYLNSTFDQNQLLNTITSIPQFADTTYTGEALEKCFDIFSVAQGMRPESQGIPKVLILLTDGQSNGNIKPIPVASRLKSLGITIVTVGVGSNLDYTELNGIASSNRVYLLSNFQTLINSFDDIIQTASSSPALIPSQTSRLSVDKDQTSFFKVSLKSALGNSSSVKPSRMRVSVNSILGSVDLFTSFDDQTPNDNEVVSDQARKRRASGSSAGSSKNAMGKLLYLPANVTNDSFVFIGVKGRNDTNSFMIKTDLVSNNISKYFVFM
jgi:putative chitinase